jgi:hypothetical protein
VLEEARHKVERLADTPSSIAHQCVDRFTHGEVPHVRIVVGSLINHVANAECVEHASDKAEVAQDLAMIRGLIGHHNLLCW